MTLQWFLFALVGPPVLALAAARFFKGCAAPPLAVVLLNGVMPGSGLAAARRPVLEVVAGVVFAQVSMFVSAGARLDYLGPIAAIGAFWGLLHTPWSPLAAQGSPDRERRETAVPPLHDSSRPDLTASSSRHPGKQTPDGNGVHDDDADCYSVAIRCTECGGSVEVPVLNHAGQCGFCGSHHLVVGQDDVLQVAVPAKIGSIKDLRETVLDHLRYRHYLKLYKRSVAPLEKRATEVGPDGGMAVRADMEAAAAAAERAITAKADRYREALAGTLEITRTQQFLAPYGHAMGTLYQAAFGRDRKTQDKVMLFTMGSVETSIAAQAACELPEMGKLSYLKSLVPAAQLGNCPRALPFVLDHDRVDQVRRNLERRQLDRSIQTIKLGSTLIEEVRAVVWRPLWVAETRAPGIDEVFLVDAGAGSVAGPGEFVDDSLLVDLPAEARDAGTGLRFQAMQCPTCGFEFRYEVDAVLHFCHNCHRVFDAHEGGKTEVEYDHVIGEALDRCDIVPFWRFPLRLATADGQEIIDLMHLKDGIDGTLDQIGENGLAGPDDLWIPAFRCINTRLMATAFARLFTHVGRHPPRVRGGRIPVDIAVNPWPVCLDEREVHSFAALYLANVFEPRDIARVNVHQVSAWLFEGRLEDPGTLTYLPVPRPVTLPFRAYVGRYRGRAVAAVTGQSQD